MMLEEEVAALQAENAQLKEQLRLALEHLAQALTHIAELETKLEQAHSQSAAPQSPFAKSSTHKQDNSEKKPRRKRAKEHNNARKRETPTHMVEHKLQACPDCGYGLRHPRLAIRRQVIELPSPSPVEVTEHQLFKSWCARCRKWHYACVDLSCQVVGHGRMGVGIASHVAYLHTTLRMPIRLIKEYLYTVHALTLSTGEIVELLHRLVQTKAMQQEEQAIKQRVLAAPIVHGDETGWREKGQNGYIWCFCTPQGERYYEYDRSRAGTVVKRILGPQFKGVLVTDFYAAYNDLPCEHQRCWVHLLRDLHELKEVHPKDEETMGWARKIHALYDQAQQRLRCAHGPPSQEQREVLYIKLIEDARELGLRYAEAKTYKEHPCHTLAKRLLLHLDALFQFVLVPGLSSDNNLAERSIRPVVVMRKVSGGSQSPKGSATRMTLASLFGTWRAKGLNPFFQCLTLLTQPPLTP